MESKEKTIMNKWQDLENPTMDKVVEYMDKGWDVAIGHGCCAADNAINGCEFKLVKDESGRVTRARSGTPVTDDDFSHREPWIVRPPVPDNGWCYLDDPGVKYLYRCIRLGRRVQAGTPGKWSRELNNHEIQWKDVYRCCALSTSADGSELVRFGMNYPIWRIESDDGALPCM